MPDRPPPPPNREASTPGTPSDPPKRAVVLLSGGLDSATCAAIARADGFRVHGLFVAYGQRHHCERDAAERVAAALGLEELRAISVDLRAIGGSALTDSIDVPKPGSAEAMETGIPVTYVPARNLVFLSMAIGFAEVIGSHIVYAGMNAIDYSGYPDCRRPFVDAFEQAATAGTAIGDAGGRMRVATPLIDLTKAAIIQRGAALGVPYHLTHSCYDPADDGAACGACDSCVLRRAGFEAADIPDPTRYVPGGAPSSGRVR